jgi:lysophospholipase L1-like esterase
VLTSWSELVTKIDRHLGPIPLAFVSIKPSPARFAILKTIRKTNDLVEATIAQRPQTMYIDVYSSMLDDEGLPFERLFIGDGLHLSRDGYLLWREVIGRCIANITDGTAAT